jgi:hypothetical protein
VKHPLSAYNPLDRLLLLPTGSISNSQLKLQLNPPILDQAHYTSIASLFTMNNGNDGCGASNGEDSSIFPAGHGRTSPYGHLSTGSGNYLHGANYCPSSSGFFCSGPWPFNHVPLGPPLLSQLPPGSPPFGHFAGNHSCYLMGVPRSHPQAPLESQSGTTGFWHPAPIYGAPGSISYLQVQTMDCRMPRFAAHPSHSSHPREVKPLALNPAAAPFVPKTKAIRTPLTFNCVNRDLGCRIRWHHRADQCMLPPPFAEKKNRKKVHKKKKQ